LFYVAFTDSKGFLFIFGLICVVVGFILHLMGVKFDDTDNFNRNEPDSIEDPGYDTNFNDYPYVFGVGVNVLGILRNSFGDL